MALLLFLPVDRAQSGVLCNGVAERKSAGSGRERNDLVGDVMADVGAASERDAGAGAPLFDDRRLVAAEVGVVRRDIADASEPQPRHLPDVGAGGQMEQRAVDAI